MTKRLIVLFAVAALCCGTAVFAQKVDFVKKGPPSPAIPGSSENTDIDFDGTVPPPVLGALDPDDSTYNRQVGDCGGPSGVGTAVFYDTITITNTLAVTGDLTVATSDPGDIGACNIDTYLTAYVPSFDPNNTNLNCRTSDDDGGPGLCSFITFSLAPGEVGVVVVSSFSNGATFDYQVNFDGSVPVELLNFTIE